MMECPICKNKTHVEIDTHADGFTENLQECGDCGTLWIQKEDREVVIHGAAVAATVN